MSLVPEFQKALDRARVPSVLRRPTPAKVDDVVRGLETLSLATAEPVVDVAGTIAEPIVEPIPGKQGNVGAAPSTRAVSFKDEAEVFTLPLEEEETPTQETSTQTVVQEPPMRQQPHTSEDAAPWPDLPEPETESELKAA
jgi:hypothetical protein